MKKLFVFLLGISFIWACGSEPTSNWTPQNLLKYGIPMTIMTPDSVEIKTMDLGIIKDVTIKSKVDEGYGLQIYASSAETTDIAKIKADKLADVKATRFFKEIVKEEEDGFIFETAVDSNNINYDFRLIVVKGDMEYVFQTDLVQMFTLEQAEQMYNSIKESK